MISKHRILGGFNLGGAHSTGFAYEYRGAVTCCCREFGGTCRIPIVCVVANEKIRCIINIHIYMYRVRWSEKKRERERDGE